MIKIHLESIKKYRTCIKSHLDILCMAFAFLLAASSTSCTNNKYGFSSPEDAIGTYREQLNILRNAKTSNTKDFGMLICKWKETKDTIINYLRKDSVLIKDERVAQSFYGIHDSIRNEMLRLSETWRYDYSDVLTLKEQTSPFKEDKEIQEAVKETEPFFESLSNTPISQSDKNSILKRYRYFLAMANKRTISCKKDMLEFIKQEDFFFRSFLAHLSEMNNEPLSDITKETDDICRNIFIASREGKITPKDAMIYMSMRTGRRLLLNAVVCVNDINQMDIKDKAQGNAYLWMIIQPFISIDQFTLATLTSEEKSNFNYITKQIPKSKKFARTFDIKLQALNYLLPQQLLKMYILSI